MLQDIVIEVGDRVHRGAIECRGSVSGTRPVSSLDRRGAAFRDSVILVRRTILGVAIEFPPTDQALLALVYVYTGFEG